MTVLSNCRRAFVRCCAVFCLAIVAGQAAAFDDETIVETIEKAIAVAIGRELSDAERAALENETRETLEFDRATHGVLYDTLRQVLAVSFAIEPEPTALKLFVPEDHLIGEHQPGMGLAYSDVYASAWLRALHEGHFDHPKEVNLTEEFIAAHVEELVQKFPSEVPENQQVMSRMNAWAAGVEASWSDMSADQQRAAVAVSTTPDIPSEDVVEKVTGTRDVIKWIAGMDLALDDEMRTQYPALVKYHEDGRTAEAMAGLFARLGAGNLAADWSEFQSLQMLQNLNNYYSHGGLLSGGDAGGIMLGLE
jgi:hypothetical protein